MFYSQGILIIKVSPLLYWESNLLNTSPPPSPFPNTLVPRRDRVYVKFWDVKEISEMLFSFALSILPRRCIQLAGSLAQQHYGCQQSTVRKSQPLHSAHSNLHPQQPAFICVSAGKPGSLLAPACKRGLEVSETEEWWCLANSPRFSRFSVTLHCYKRHSKDTIT